MAAAKTTVTFDHHSEEYLRRWPELTAEARSACPVSWTEAHGGYWIVTGYDAVRGIAHDADHFLSGRTDGVSSMFIPSTPVPLLPLEADAPLHPQLRRPLNPIFTTKMAEAWKPFVAHTADALIDRFSERGACDLVRELAKPAAATVNLVLVGLPGEDNEFYIDSAGIMVREPAGSPLHEKARAAVHEMEDTIRDLLEDRRRHPQDDVATVIAHIQVDGEPAPFEALHNVLETVVSGGVSTTVSLMAHSFMWLPEDPADRAGLLADEDALTAAVREYLRLCTPSANLGRLCSAPAEVAGQRIEEGERVLLSYAGANRDPDEFADPDEIVPGRDNADRHLSFGIGKHRCLGMHVAMALATTVVRRLLERLPDFRVQMDDVQRYERIPVVNGVISVPATFTPAPAVGAAIPKVGPPLPERVRI